MVSRLILASLLMLAACRESLETEPDAPPRPDGAPDAFSISPACLEAQDYSDLGNIADKIFKFHCTFSSCHDGTGTGAGDLDLIDKDDVNDVDINDSYNSLVNVPSRTSDMANPPGNYDLVVPGEPNRSYLMFLLRHIPADQMVPPAGQPHTDVGFMPQEDDDALPPICFQKRAAIERWILAGAPPRS